MVTAKGRGLADVKIASPASRINRSLMTTEQTVFVVDDELADRELAATLAKTVGVQVELFHTAEAFLQRCERATAGCLVVDLWLPGMSGLELLEVMHRDGIRLPTIVISAYADVATAVRVMQHGAVTLLEKPYRAEELRDAIRQGLALDVQIRQNAAGAADVKKQLASLTPSEEKVLELILAGRTNRTISQSLGMPLRTVESRRHGLMVEIQRGFAGWAGPTRHRGEVHVFAPSAAANPSSSAPLSDHNLPTPHETQSYVRRLHGPATGD